MAGTEQLKPVRNNAAGPLIRPLSRRSVSRKIIKAMVGMKERTPETPGNTASVAVRYKVSEKSI